MVKTFGDMKVLALKIGRVGREGGREGWKDVRVGGREGRRSIGMERGHI